MASRQCCRALTVSLPPFRLRPSTFAHPIVTAAFGFCFADALAMDPPTPTLPASPGFTPRSSRCSAPPGLRVLQWNLLADGLAQSGNFSRVDQECLEWSYRAPLLLSMILKDQPHVMCLQELNHFEQRTTSSRN